MKTKIFLFAALLLIILPTSNACADWLIYHKPAFEGKVIDAETKEPIEGAVVVAIYNKTLMSLGAGTNSYEINVREALTNKDGYFRIPSYITLIQPFSWESWATFIIYKPGYGSYPSPQTHPLLSLDEQERYFSLGWGKEEKFEAYLGDWKDGIMTLKAGLIELPQLHTREERLRTIPGRPSFTDPKDLPFLYKNINEERVGFGLDPVGKK